MATDVSGISLNPRMLVCVILDEKMISQSERYKQKSYILGVIDSIDDNQKGATVRTFREIQSTVYEGRIYVHDTSSNIVILHPPRVNIGDQKDPVIVAMLNAIA